MCTRPPGYSGQCLLYEEIERENLILDTKRGPTKEATLNENACRPGGATPPGVSGQGFGRPKPAGGSDTPWAASLRICSLVTCCLGILWLMSFHSLKFRFHLAHHCEFLYQHVPHAIDLDQSCHLGLVSYYKHARHNINGFEMMKSELRITYACRLTAMNNVQTCARHTLFSRLSCRHIFSIFSPCVFSFIVLRHIMSGSMGV